MSLNSAMLAGVSGLISNSSALAAISDNIANVNTVGYKRNAVNFNNVVTSQSAGRYSAGGVQGKSTQYVSQQGLLQTSTSSTDIAISGDGFFVVSDSAAKSGNAFTRAGAFQLDADGYLKNPSGYYLQGWAVKADGTIDANPSDLGRLTAINVKNIGATVRPSTEGQITANLNADQAVSAGFATYNAVTNSMAAYDPDAGTGTKPDFSVQMNVVDSKGGSHTVAVSFLKSTTANEWSAEIYAVPASDVTAGAGLAPGQIRAGTVAFNPDGSIDMANTDLFASATDPSITFGASSAAAPAAGAVNWASGLGIDGQTLKFAIGQAGKGGVGQLADPSTVKTVSTNGAGVGEVTGVEISDDGFVSAVFDNGEVRKLAQIAVATFPNSDGLSAISGNAYAASTNSGGFSLKRPGEGGAGDVAGSSLEASTVDLSSEFTGLITTQRAYSASSKIIMTADQMMEELLSIKR